VFGEIKVRFHVCSSFDDIEGIVPLLNVGLRFPCVRQKIVEENGTILLPRFGLPYGCDIFFVKNEPESQHEKCSQTYLRNV
jgi:hypothetical protein